LIKLDIVNAVLAKLDGAGVSRVRAEQAVETVFESLKMAWPAASGSNAALRSVYREAAQDRNWAQSAYW